jgi:O-antigen/teichoic acid export membrane protein
MGEEPIINKTGKYTKQEKIILGLLVFISLSSTMSPILFLIDNDVRKKKQTTDMLTSFILALSAFFFIWSIVLILMGYFQLQLHTTPYIVVALLSLGAVFGVCFIVTLIAYIRRTINSRKKTGYVN